MPKYDFVCRKCQGIFEETVGLKKKNPSCRFCGGRTDKILTVPSIVFRGSGFYKTDYKEGGK